MSKIFKGLNVLISLFLVAIAVGVAFIAFPQFGNKALIVRSGSMAPTIEVGSIVVARPAEQLISPQGDKRPTYGKGDIIAFRSESNPKTIITHKVVEVEAGKDGVFYKTKGDANEEIDGWSVNEKNILGKVQLNLPYLGRILTFAKSDIGFPTLIIFPAVIVILLEILSIIKEIRKRRRAEEEKYPFEFYQYGNQDRGISLRLRGGSKYNWSGFKILIPLLAFSLVVPVGIAVLNDTETSTGNIIQASSDFSTPAPSEEATIYVSDPYTCSGGASNTTTSRGTVTISKDSNLDISVTLSGALPNANYDLWVNQDPGACPLPSPTVSSFITTNGSGNGSNTLTDHPLVGGATNFWVSLVSGSDVLRSTSVSF